MRKSYRLKLKAPVTVRLLDSGCAALGVDPDKAIRDPAGVLDQLSITPAGALAFLDAVCVRVPRKVRCLPIGELVAVAEWAATDFFLEAFNEQHRARIDKWKQSGIRPAFQAALPVAG